MTLADGMLTIRGEKKSERDEKNQDKNWHVVERSYGSFNRTISLPFDPDPANVEAKVDKMRDLSRRPVWDTASHQL